MLTVPTQLDFESTKRHTPGRACEEDYGHLRSPLEFVDQMERVEARAAFPSALGCVYILH